MNTATNWAGQTLTLNIEKVAHGGIFVARHEGRVVFVSHVLPGEKVKAWVYEDQGKGFCRAEPTEILEASPDRVKHFWKSAASAENRVGAGGAEFGHIKLSRQRELKADVIEEALSRMAGIELRPEVEPVPGDDAANGLGYRTRVQLHVDEAGNAGPFRERSHEVVEVRTLPLATEDIQELGLHLKNWQDVSKIEIAASSTGQVQWLIDKKVKGDERLIERVGGRTFRLSPGAFWQVHKGAAEVLSQAVIAAINVVGIDRNANNLDLYGGVGLFASTMSAKFGSQLRITTVESFKQATEDAKLNLSDLPNAKAVLAPVERFVVTLPVDRKATIVLDPPRSGAGAKVVDALVKSEAKHIVYVACDPVALARDLKPLLAAGYRLASLRAFDLFPHTHHVECVASLVRD